jgi:uncharacterized protein YkwD
LAGVLLAIGLMVAGLTTFLQTARAEEQSHPFDVSSPFVAPISDDGAVAGVTNPSAPINLEEALAADAAAFNPGSAAPPEAPATTPAAQAQQAPAPASSDGAPGVRSDMESQMVAGINAQRAAAGLPGLSVMSSLTQVARARSSDMIARGYFGHNGGAVFGMLDAAGIGYSWAGENISRNNYPDGESVAVAMRDLMASPTHRANILHGSFTRVGVGCVKDSGGMKYCTMVFIG